RSAVRARLLDDLIDLFPRSHVVSERDAAPVRAVVRDAHVARELLPRPEHDHDAVRLEERRLLDLERDRPAERLVERLRAVVIGDAEGDQRHALLHRRSTPSNSPVSYASTTAWTRSRRSSFWRMCVMCVLTVVSLM